MSEPQGERLARLAVAGHGLAFLGIWATILTFGGVEGTAAWYVQGGFFMHPILLLSIAQLIVGVLQARRHLRAPLSMTALLAMPCAAILMGVAANLVGLGQVSDLLVTEPADRVADYWSSTAALSATPQVFGYLVGAFGCIAAAGTAVAGLRATVPSSGHATSTRMTVGWVLAGVAVIVAAILLPRLFVWQATSEPGLKALVWPVVIALTGVGLFAAIRRKVAVLDNESSCAGFRAALLAVVAVAGSVLLLGAALRLSVQSSMLSFLSSAPPDMFTRQIEAAFRAAAAHVATTGGTISLGVAVLLLGACVLVAARRGAGGWARKHGADGLATLFLAGAVLAASWFVGYEARSQLTVVKARKANLEPNLVDLPTSSSVESRWGDRTVQFVGPHPGYLHLYTDSGYQLYLDGQRFGYGFPSGDAKEDDEPTVVQRLSWSFHKPTWSSPFSDTCKLGVMSLAVDRSAKADEIERLLHRWMAEGGCRLELLVDEPEEQRRKIENRFGVVGDLEAARHEPNAINIYLASEIPSHEGSHDDALALTLTISEDAVEVSSRTSSNTAIRRTDGGLPLTALSEHLVGLKKSNPEERFVFVRPTGKTTMQDVVSVLDTARRDSDPDGNQDWLFDEAVWLLPHSASTASHESENN